jgi:hypothetical protein
VTDNNDSPFAPPDTTPVIQNAIDAHDGAQHERTEAQPQPEADGSWIQDGEDLADALSGIGDPATGEEQYEPGEIITIDGEDFVVSIGEDGGPTLVSEEGEEFYFPGTEPTVQDIARQGIVEHEAVMELVDRFPSITCAPALEALGPILGPDRERSPRSPKQP